MAETYSETRLILCEGESDNAFFRKLMFRRAIGGFQVVEPAKGNTGFGSRLQSIRANRDFGKLKAIIIVSDNDNDLGGSFRAVAQQIHDAGGYGVPRKRKTPKRSPDHPAVAIYMLPSANRKGCLETLITESILSARPNVENCIDDYSRCVGSNGWDKSKRDKMRLHSLLSVVCENDPAVSTSWMWKDEKGLLNLLDDPAFNQLADFLRDFPILP